MVKRIFGTLAFFYAVSSAAMPLNSQYAVVVEDGTEQVLFEKNANVKVPIASLTKLMTAMVILDAKPNMDEIISIEQADFDMLKHSRSHVPLGTSLARREMLQLALMSSDNRAAAALARTYPGGNLKFVHAVRAKMKSLGMSNTVIEEATGLSPNNTSTAADLVKMAVAASRYPEIADITTDSSNLITIKGHRVKFRNTNRLVGSQGWDILLSKTGFTNEAGNCLIMRIKLAGKKATLVLLNAGASSARFVDALKIRRFLTMNTKRQEQVASIAP
ncbi:MAG: serine hydrolase [Undibacterium sp.]|uniref:serine hydrolase n=1 Tax=Undibacterium sp. TaxID=1914977 RepID=UPI00271C5DCC|nr:serine hydrolase [Undibacterium sp.]MDO8652714.1 serine hydrolase [Undibacterium sp.]